MFIQIPTPDGRIAVFDVKDMKTDEQWESARDFVKGLARHWEQAKKFEIKRKKLEIKQKELELEELESWFDKKITKGGLID